MEKFTKIKLNFNRKNMKKTKFDLLFEEIMNNVSDKELYGTDIHNTILKIYRME